MEGLQERADLLAARRKGARGGRGTRTRTPSSSGPWPPRPRQLSAARSPGWAQLIAGT